MVNLAGYVLLMGAGLEVKMEIQYVKVWTQPSYNYFMVILSCCILFLHLASLVECNPLLNIPYGHVHYSSVDTTTIQPGDIVTYSCDPPYILEGADYRICMSNGTWSEEEPQCNGELITMIANAQWVRVHGFRLDTHALS